MLKTGAILLVCLVVAYGADAETAGRAERFFTENGLVTEVLGYVA